MEISDLYLKELKLEGSLSVFADRIMGFINEQGKLQYSKNIGRCVFKNVTVRNRGIDWSSSRPFWKGDWVRWESVEIILKGDSEWIGENLVLEGSHRFEVEDGVSMRVTQELGKLVVMQTQKKANSLKTYGSSLLDPSSC